MPYYHHNLIYDAIVIGAGAAGLFCAATAGARGRRVLVLEHSAEPGRKILISGGGHANFTNLRTRPENFLSANRHFAKSALSRYTPADFLRLVGSYKIPWRQKEPGQLFCDGPARRILDMLLEECRRAKVELLLDTKISAVSRDTRFRIHSSRGVFESSALVVATGGLSIPRLGATDLGYRLARQFGLEIVAPFPALVPLVFNSEDKRLWSDLAGVSTEVKASTGNASFRGKMLFTHSGLSGPAILQISSYWAPGSAIRIDLLPGVDFSRVDPSHARTELALRLPNRLATRWMEVEGFTQPLPSVRRMDARLHDWRVTPAGSEGFSKAEVTGGGVSTAALSSKTMEARNAPGLFFIGEVVDVTGHLGGYNFQWAWSSAHACGSAL